MDYKEIKKLMDDVEKSKLTEVEIEYPDGTKVRVKKGGKPEHPPIPLHDTRTSMVPLEYGVPYPMQTGVPATTAEKVEEKDEGKIVKSPMVGTFYSKSSPTAEPYVKVGSKVKKGDTLCIIEAMKLMNEIESEFDGEIVEILIKDGDLVDYGKPLFRIK